MAETVDAAGDVYVSAFYADWCTSCSTTLFLIPAGARSPSAQIAISASEPNLEDFSPQPALRFLAFGANGIYTNDLGDNSVVEFNLGLTAKVNTITTGINHPYAIAIEP